jgi:hypothetical protein
LTREVLYSASGRHLCADVCRVGRIGTGPMKYTFNFRDIWTQWEYIAEGISVTLLPAVVSMITG